MPPDRPSMGAAPLQTGRSSAPEPPRLSVATPATGAFALGTMALLFGSPALAAPDALLRAVPAEVRVVRTQTALGCPDGAALTARIEGILQRPLAATGDGGASIRIDVTFRRIDEAYVAELEFRGRKTGIRELRDHAPHCAPLADAVSVAIALVLDRALETGGASASSIPSEPAEPTGKGDRAEPQSQVTRRPDPARTMREARDADARPHLRLSVAAGLTNGFGDAVAPVLVADLGVPVGRWSFTTGFGYVPASRTEFRGGTVQNSLAFGSASGCWQLLAQPVILGPCGSVGVGRLRGNGTGYDQDLTYDTLWTALGGGLVAEHTLWGPLFLGVQAQLWVPLRTQRYLVENAGIAWRSPRAIPWLTGHLGIGF